MDVSTFRVDFPEFASTSVYPETRVQRYLTLSAKFINTDLWGDTADYGAELFIAHNLVLDKRASDSAATGAAPGGVSGSVSSKSLDKASVSYDTKTTTHEGAGSWNQTTYGIRFYELSRSFGFALQMYGQPNDL